MSFLLCPRCGSVVEESYIRVTDDNKRDLCHSCWPSRLNEIQTLMDRMKGRVMKCSLDNDPGPCSLDVDPGPCSLNEDPGPCSLDGDDKPTYNQGERVVDNVRLPAVGAPDVAEEKVWVDAPDVKAALHALLDGKLVYDSEELAVRVTGRKPVQVQLIARSRP